MNNKVFDLVGLRGACALKKTDITQTKRAQKTRAQTKRAQTKRKEEQGEEEQGEEKGLGDRLYTI